MDVIGLLGTIAVTSIITVILSTLIMRKYSTTLQETIKGIETDIFKKLDQASEIIEAQKAITSRGMTMISDKAVDARQMRKGERLLAGGVIDYIREEYPEYWFIFERITPEGTEYFQENPEVLIRIAQRYGIFKMLEDGQLVGRSQDMGKSDIQPI